MFNGDTFIGLRMLFICHHIIIRMMAFDGIKSDVFWFTFIIVFLFSVKNHWLQKKSEMRWIVMTFPKESEIKKVKSHRVELEHLSVFWCIDFRFLFDYFLEFTSLSLPVCVIFEYWYSKSTLIERNFVFGVCYSPIFCQTL